ncbi:MAG: hypothetical protein ACM3RP_00025 [Chitinophagales bacterium]
MRLEIDRRVLAYRPEELEAWERGERDWCSDHRCREKGATEKNPVPHGAGGYAEAVVGRYFEEELKLHWAHHDFDAFGVNLDQKYPRTQQIIEAHLRAMSFDQGHFKVALGQDRVVGMRELYRLLGPLTAPDIMAWKPDGSGLRFAEAKLVKAKDGKVTFADDLDYNEKFRTKAERWGLLVLARYFDCPVEVYWVVPEGSGLEGRFAGPKVYDLG